MVSRGGAGAALVAVLAFVWAGPAYSETFEQVTPDIPAANTTAPPIGLPALEEGRRSDEVLLPALTGLVFVATPDAIISEGMQYAGLETAGFDLLSEEDTNAQLQHYIGQPLSLKVLDQMVATVITKYRAADRPFVDVIVPPQDITSGTVQVLILEFVAGDVRTEGDFQTPSEFLTAEIRTKQGMPLDAAQLSEDLDWLNRSMFRRVELVLERGERFGETDLILQVDETAPWRVYAGMDNTGSRATGRERYMLGGNFGGIVLDDALLSYQYISSRELLSEGRLPFGLTGKRPAYAAHSFDYSFPLTGRGEVSVFGFYAESRPNLGQIVSSVGKSWQLSARYRAPVLRYGYLQHRLSAGVDFKRTNNNLGFGGTIVSNSNTDIAQAVLAWRGNGTDRWGATSAGLSLALSPGGLTAFNNDSDYQPSATAVGRTGANARYAVLRADVERSLSLPGDLTLTARAHGQLASTNLLSNEQIYAGGVRSVRGFEENEAAGDHGVYANLELASPAWSPLEQAISAQDAGRAYLFLDRGDVWLDSALPGEIRQKSLMSAGAGVLYQLGPYLSFDVSHGWQLIGKGNSRVKGERTHFRAIVSF